MVGKKSLGVGAKGNFWAAVIGFGVAEITGLAPCISAETGSESLGGAEGRCDFADALVEVGAVVGGAFFEIEIDPGGTVDDAPIGGSSSEFFPGVPEGGGGLRADLGVGDGIVGGACPLGDEGEGL